MGAKNNIGTGFVKDAKNASGVGRNILQSFALPFSSVGASRIYTSLYESETFGFFQKFCLDEHSQSEWQKKKQQAQI